MDSQTTQALLTTLLPLAGEFGFGGTIFFIFGYTLKKVFKILAMIFVFFFGLFGVGQGAFFTGSAVGFLAGMKRG